MIPVPIKGSPLHNEHHNQRHMTKIFGTCSKAERRSRVSHQSTFSMKIFILVTVAIGILGLVAGNYQ